MEAIRKQATKLRLQVAKRQQAVLNQISGGLGGSGNITTNEAELQQHQILEKYYASTRTNKHFQRDMVRGVQGYIVTGSKEIEVGTKLSEDTRRYGAENKSTNGNALTKFALSFSRARAQMENEHEKLLKSLETQVVEPLRAMVIGAPLEEARHLAQRYERVRLEAEAQAIEVTRRQVKVKESNGNPDNVAKLEASEAKLHELKSNLAKLGKEATAAMAAVEGQQQQLTRLRLIAMVEAERNYHRRVLEILDRLEEEMWSEREPVEGSPSAEADNPVPPPISHDEVHGEPASDVSTDGSNYFLGEVVHPYQAESNGELTLSTGDYVVVRKVLDNGWAEGECKGNAGWFPIGCIERRESVLASKAVEAF